MRRAGAAVLVLAAAVVIAVVVIAFVAGDDDGTGIVEVLSDEHALSVKEAIHRAPQETFAVRGYAYDDGAFVQLCNGLTDDEPPRCAGPSILLENLDLARLPLVQAEVDGRRVLYTGEPVLLGGRLDGTRLTVVDVLSLPEE